jgi:hypothetical protein
MAALGHIKITRRALTKMGWERGRQDNGRFVSAVLAVLCWKHGPLRVEVTAVARP